MAGAGRASRRSRSIKLAKDNDPTSMAVPVGARVIDVVRARKMVERCAVGPSSLRSLHLLAEAPARVNPPHRERGSAPFQELVAPPASFYATATLLLQRFRSIRDSAYHADLLEDDGDGLRTPPGARGARSTDLGPPLSPNTVTELPVN